MLHCVKSKTACHSTCSVVKYEWKVIFMLTISTSELATNINRYVALLGHGDILITQNKKLVARLTSADTDNSSDKAEKTMRISAAKALFGILPPDVDLERAREERLS